ncbi:DUF4493 domain-containing protein [Phocaeicola sp.]|uniref:DUF4493 domain-containing protein n=1 Tax=Phocaeicola sp. TaxID=2773926 RepID=UPI00307BEAA6
MKHIYTILLIASTLFFFACQQEDNLTGGATGYLRLTVNEDMSTNSRADVPEDYKPEQIAVQIVNAEGETVEETEDWELWQNKSIELPVGTYTIKASSNGWDGQAAGFDIPYYTGSKEVTITAGGEVNETITCTLANVKVTVNFDKALLTKVRSVAATVDDDAVSNGASPTYSLSFESTETRSAYFPVSRLFANITVVNNEGASNSMRKELTDAEGNPVKARDHFILNIKESGTGESGISVTVDPTTHEYSYTFNVSTKPTSGATMTAGAWDRLAYLQATNVVSGTGVSTEGMKFQYREASETAVLAETDEASWTDVVTTTEENKYTAMLSGLTAETAYEYRLVNGNGDVISTQSFTTSAADAQTALYNGGFELWSQNGQTVYPENESSAGNTTSFWNTSNPGTSQGLGAIGGAVNPTTGITSPVVSGTYAAKLQSTNKLSVFAAASLYTGKFQGLSGMSANMEFGQPFTSRPIALHGYYQYTPQKINHVDRTPDGVTITNGETMDECSIFIALAKKSFTFNNKKEEEYIDYEGDDNIIAYGALPSGAATNETANNGYKEFTIPLQYKESQFGETPTHIIIVCSASKYGDYMTGADNSLLYLDDFSLIYEGTPTIWKNK